jgi:hypothetical protein
LPVLAHVDERHRFQVLNLAPDARLIWVRLRIGTGGWTAARYPQLMVREATAQVFTR